MLELKPSVELPRFPVQDLELVRHIDYFDGPLISEFKHPRGDRYLYYWCECDDTANRWMVLRVSEASILRLVNRFVPLDFVVPRGCLDDFVYMLDIGSNHKILTTRLVDVDDLPEEYHPGDGAYIQGEASHEERSYAVLVEGDWSIPDLGEFPRCFNQAYSLLYGLNILHLPQFPQYPWKGGFSSMHFYKWAESSIPSEDQPQVSKIQIASPGFMRFALDGEAARQVSMCVTRYKSNNSAIASAFSNLEAYIKTNQLNDIHNSTDPRWSQFDPSLLSMSRHLIEEFKVVNANSFVNTCQRPFEAAKIAMSFYRRIRKLVQFEKNSLVRFPRDD